MRFNNFENKGLAKEEVNYNAPPPFEFAECMIAKLEINTCCSYTWQCFGNFHFF